jgi:prophage regulatory protein
MSNHLMEVIMKDGLAFEIEYRLLKVKECLKIVPVSASNWWAGVKDGRFPQPIKIGGNTFWRYSDVMKVVQGD